MRGPGMLEIRAHKYTCTRDPEIACLKLLWRKKGIESFTPTLLMCSCCCWNCCLCFSRNCWCCCWITSCWRAWVFWGRGADWVRPSGRCCRSLWIEGETLSPPTRGCACRGSPERYQSEDNMEEKTAEEKQKEEERKGENSC